MYDRRIYRGNTYASMVVPATTAPGKGKMKETLGQKPTAEKDGVFNYFWNNSLGSRNRGSARN